METPSRRLPLGVTMTIGSNGFQITIIYGVREWLVVYPVIPEPDEHNISRFMPGHMPQWATMPLMEFLNLLADEYKLPHVLIANVD